MCVNLSDPNIPIAYQAVVNHDESLNWFLLRYIETSNAFSLYASGTQAVSEMRRSMENVDGIFIGLCEEEFRGKKCYVLITYIPEWVSSVGRDEALMHSHYISAIFKAQDATLTIYSLETLTSALLQQTLASPYASNPVNRSTSEPQGGRPIPRHPDEQIRRVVSEHTSRKEPLLLKVGVLSRFLRKKCRSKDMPPPIPPKDRVGPSFTMNPHARGSGTEPYPNPADISMRGPLADCARRINNVSQFGEAVHQHQTSFSSPDRGPMQLHSAHFRAKWASESIGILDPAEKARRRIEAKRKREQEEREVAQQEEERLACLRSQKEEILRREAEEEQQRKARLVEETRRATAERAHKERERKRFEEAKARELDERRRIDRERRLDEGKRMENWRKERNKQLEEAARRREESKHRAGEDLKARIKEKVKETSQEESPMTGWVTVQTSESLEWRRRFFKFDTAGSRMLLYRSPQDTFRTLDVIELRGHVSALKEWYEGYEALEAIPHSFAMEFNDGQNPWCMFSDTDTEKIELLGFLHQLARLRL